MTQGGNVRWSVFSVGDGKWQWSAHGPAGSTYSYALTEADARQRAQVAAESLGRWQGA